MPAPVVQRVLATLRYLAARERLPELPPEPDPVARTRAALRRLFEAGPPVPVRPPEPRGRGLVPWMLEREELPELPPEPRGRGFVPRMLEREELPELPPEPRRAGVGALLRWLLLPDPSLPTPDRRRQP